MTKVIIFFLLLIIFIGCNQRKLNNTVPINQPSSIPKINYSVIKYFPHDNTLFTEGFLIHDGKFFESTGSPKDLDQTKSLIGSIDSITGKMDVKVQLDKSKYFGEGIVFFKEKLYQLTYKNNIGFIYNDKTFKLLETFHYSNQEGWGLTTDGINLIMSDGTENLTLLDPSTLQPIKKLRVTVNEIPIKELNELEFIKGYIYANIWKTDLIFKIDPGNGKVIGEIDLSSLVLQEKINNPNADVLNGIAYDSTYDRIFVTGKLWTKIYEISLSQ